MGLLAQREPRLRGRALVEVRHATRILVGARERFEREGDFARELLERHDPERVLAYWVYERVVVLAVEAAAEVGLTHPLWEDAAEQTRAVARASAATADLAALKLTRVLADAGIRSVVLKGAPLAERVHGSVARRHPSIDLDVLVDTDELFRASEIAQTLGWSAPDDPILSNGLPIHHLTLRGSGPLPTLELHWRVQWYDDTHAVGLLDRAVQRNGLPVLADADLLDVLLLCWARDGFHRLKLAADIAAWWDEGGESDTAPRLSTVVMASASAARAVVDVAPHLTHPSDTPRSRLAVRVARTDRPASVRRGGPSQRALVDVALAPHWQRRQRFVDTWLWPTPVSRFAHPWVPPPLTLGMRLLSATRTLWDSALLLSRRKPETGRCDSR